MKRGDLVWAALLAAVLIFLVLPATNSLFTSATEKAPYTMGFMKFALLATMGEFLAIRILNKAWKAPQGVGYKIILWGLIGVLITLMFRLFPAGVAAAAGDGYLPAAAGWFGKLLFAFMASLIMNITFGPVFMAAHRIADGCIDSRSQGEALRVSAVIAGIDWPAFIRFVIGKTIPVFWIPMHTVAFLLPADYRILFAAFLSIVLGAIMAYAKQKSQTRTA